MLRKSEKNSELIWFLPYQTLGMVLPSSTYKTKKIQNRENSEKGIPFEIENIVTWAKFIYKFRHVTK